MISFVKRACINVFDRTCRLICHLLASHFNLAWAVLQRWIKGRHEAGGAGGRRVKGAEQEESNLPLQQEGTRRTERGVKAAKESGVRTEQCDYRTWESHTSFQEPSRRRTAFLIFFIFCAASMAPASRGTGNRLSITWSPALGKKWVGWRGRCHIGLGSGGDVSYDTWEWDTILARLLNTTGGWEM